MENQFIVFDWKGKMAHFRQFDTNSSSLSYSFPPPTVIMGMIAGILGMQRDEYYDILSPEQLKMSVQIKMPPRKIMQSMNYIFAKSPNDLNMSGDNPYTQIPVELLVAPGFPNEELCYRIVLQTGDETLSSLIREAVSTQRYKYLPYLGSAPFQSWLEWCGPVRRVTVIEDAEVTIGTIADIPSVDLSSLSIAPVEGTTQAFYREHVRRYFKGERQPGKIMDIVWEKNRQQITARFKKPVYQIELAYESLTACMI